MVSKPDPIHHKFRNLELLVAPMLILLCFRPFSCMKCGSKFFRKDRLKKSNRFVSSLKVNNIKPGTATASDMSI